MRTYLRACPHGVVRGECRRGVRRLTLVLELATALWRSVALLERLHATFRSRLER